MQKTSEETRKADPQLFRDVFKASPIGIAVENLDGQPLFVNPALCAMLGFSEEEMRRKHCVEFSPPEDAQKDWRLFEQLRAGSINHYQLEKRFLRRDGSLVWGRLTISLLSALTSPLVVAMVEDITERRRFREERIQYAAIVESSGDAIISKNLDGVIRSWNSGAERMFGYSREEATGEAITLIIPTWLRDEERLILERLARGAHIAHYETRRVAKGGRIIDVSLTISPIKNAEGTVTGISTIARDVTERKQSEEALSRVSQRLIEAQEQERSRLARELHDDISQQLALLVISLEGMKQGLPASAAELASQIEAVSSRVADLGKDVQELSHRLHSPKLELLGLAAAAASFCQEFSNLHRVQIDFHSENVPKDLPREISLCLFRVLQEALQNAAKHSGSNHFQVALTAETNQIDLTVQDGGVGFQPEEAFQGPGLGLTSMKERLKLVEGELLINSRLHLGTTLRAQVPFHTKAKSAGANA